MIELPRRWLTIASNKLLWGDGGTYASVPVEQLPPVGPLDGTFAWLTPCHPAIAATDRMRLEGAASIGDELVRAASDVATAGLALPRELVTFLSTPELHARMPSATSCYFDLGARLVEIPGHDGPERLLRFMNDQQVVVTWYLLLEPGGSHQIVVASPAWHDSDEDLEEQEEREDMALDDAMTPTNLAICGASLEEFLKRFWIENTLWFSVNHGHPAVDGELKTYVDHVARLRAAAGR